MSKSALRRRVAPSVPFVLEYSDASGTYKEALQLSYNWNGLALIEEKLGKSTLLDIGELLDNPTATTLSVLLWAAVQENHPEYDGEEGLATLRCNMTLATALAVRAACSRAFITQLPPEQVSAFEAAIAGTTPPLAQSPAEPKV
jgi:hypothetical protein